MVLAHPIREMMEKMDLEIEKYTSALSVGNDISDVSEEDDELQDEIDKLKRHEATPLPAELDYHRVEGLSNEIRQKLSDTRPETLAHAARISGVTPAAISILLVHLKKRRLITNAEVANG